MVAKASYRGLLALLANYGPCPGIEHLISIVK
jgi:hypothetical protein